MSLTLGDNFSYGGSKPLDARFSFPTVAAMKAASESTLYDGIKTFCVETQKDYKFLSSNTVDPTTGKWREDTVSIVVDDALSDSSTNPVQNKVVKSAIDGKVSTSATAGLLKNDGTVDTKTYIESSKAYSTDDSSFTGIDDADYVPVYDSSASAKKKTLWSNIKSVLKTYFDTLYSTVRSRSTPASGGTTLSLVNTGDMYTWNNKQNTLTAGANISFDGNTINAPFPVAVNKFDKANLYSTTEKVVGCWTDGRPVYQKVIEHTIVSGEGPSLSIPIGASVNEFCSHQCILANASTGAMLIPAIISDNTTGYNLAGKDENYGADVMINYILRNNNASKPNEIHITAGFYHGNTEINQLNTYVGRKFIFILQYTKTTDAANSFNYADENDYSTTEKIVGTWIDGKPVYKKTFIGTSSNNNDKTTVGTINNARVYKIEGVISASSTNISNSDVTVQISATDTKASGDTQDVSLFVYYSDSDIILAAFNPDNIYRNKGYAITVYYTKTTD